MARVEQYAQWLIQNQDKKGTPDFETVASAYRSLRTAPAPQPTAPSTERTYGEAAKDIGAGVVSGIGSLVQLPGQLYGLATGDFSKTGALGAGEGISKYAEEMKSAGLKAREAERSRKVAESAKEGQFQAFGTALSETVKDPALLLSFIAEQAPQLLVPFGAARGVGMAARGLGAGEAAVGKAAVSGAVGAGGVQQGADVGAGAYENIYKELKSKGASDTEAAQGALTLARQAGAAAGTISLLAQRLPGARQLEEVLAGAPGKASAITNISNKGKFTNIIPDGRIKSGISTAAGETLGEIPEEVGGKFVSNLAMQQVKPEQSLTEGLGEAAAMATIGGVGLGGAAGLARRPATPEVAQTTPETTPFDVTKLPPEILTRIEEITGVAQPQQEQQPMLSAEEANRQRINMLQQKVDAESQAISTALPESPQEKAARAAAPPATQPSLNEQMPQATPLAELEAKQAEIDRLRLEAGLPTGASSKTPGVQPEQVVAEETPIPKIVDNRPLEERAANNRLLVMKNMLQNQGGDPNSLTIVPHPTAEGRFAIQSLDVPVKFTKNLPETAINKPESPVVIDPVNAYMEIARRTNTPASMRLVKDFEAGIVTREDVEAAIEAEKKAGMPLPLNYQGNGEPWFIAAPMGKPRGDRTLPVSATLTPTPEGPERPPVTKPATQVYGEMEPPTPGTSGRPPVVEPPPVEPPPVEIEPPTPSTEMPKNLLEFKLRMPIFSNNPEVRAANEQGNFAQLAETLAKSKNPAIRRIGELGRGVSTKIKLKKPGNVGAGVAGVYRYADDSIQMAKAYAGDEHTNAHETLHGLISKAQRYPTERQKPIAEQIEKLYKHVKKELRRQGKDFYGLTNEREFTAEAMTNPEFQYELMQISYGGRRSAWTAFTRMVADLLGIQNVNALTEVMNLVDKLAQTKQPKGVKVDKGEVDYSQNPKFQKWFGNSKVVDENGNPLVVYHGTSEDINQFLASDEGALGGGIYFTDDPDAASRFADRSAKERSNKTGQNVMPVYIRIEKMLDVDNITDDQMDSIIRTIPRSIDQLEKLGYEKYDEATRQMIDEQLNQFVNFELDENRKFDPRKLAKILGDGSSETFAKIMQKAGFDGMTRMSENLDNNAPYREYTVFNPTQAKSATGNIGEFSLESPEIDQMKVPKSVAEVKQKVSTALQKNKPLTAENLPGLPSQFVTASNNVFKPQSRTIVEKITDMQDRFWQRLAQGIADQYRTIKDYSPVGYMQARLSKSVDGALEGILFNGHVFNDGGALNIKPNTKGLIEAMQPLGNEVDRYQMWVALNREARLPEEKRSRNDDMDYLVANRAKLAEGTIDGKSRLDLYNSVLKDMNGINKSVLDVALDQGLIDKFSYDNFAGDMYYIPFYRQMEEDVKGGKTPSGLTRQNFSKALKGGGDRPFGDLMENTLRNWSHILSASMKNQAAVTTIRDASKLGAVEPNLKGGMAWKDGKVVYEKTGELVGDGSIKPEYTESGSDTVPVKENGKPVHYIIKDPLLLESITSIGYLGPQSKFLDVSRDFKNLLQYGVTMSPAFKVNNLFRDSVQAMAVSDLKKNPFANVVDGWISTDKNNPAHISALAGGAIFNFGTAYEGNQSKLIKRLIDKGVKESDILDTPAKIKSGLSKLFEKYEELGNKSEAANRMALYIQLREKGFSHLEASFQARDLMDFSMQGSFGAFRYLTQVVPFMNARIQGLYKLGRDGILPTSRVFYNSMTGKEIDLDDKKKAQSFSIITSAVCLASLALYGAFKDDEEFQKRSDWDRDNFWWIRLPGMEAALRIPKPFEIGALGTIAERTAEQIFDADSEGKQFTNALSRMMWDTFAMNPLPQIIKPVVDLYSNKDSFTGAPIETAGMEALSKAERKADTTSPLAMALAPVLNIALPEKAELSPVQVDYAIKGYFGWLGGTVASTSMYAVMPFKEGAYPDTQWMDKASLGFVKSLPSNMSQYTTAFYESNKQIQQAFADMRHYAEIGEMDKVEQIMEEKGDKIALQKLYTQTSKQMANIRKQISIVTNDKSMDGATKREEIDRMKELISMLAKQAEDTRKSYN